MSSQANEKPKRGAGRPRAPIDWKQVDEWIEAGCRGGFIADRLGIHTDTLYERCQLDHNSDFTTYSNKRRACGDDCIAKTQYEVATVDKNTTMLIWLGKQRCGQKEQHETPLASPETTAQLKALLQQIKDIQSPNSTTDDKSNNTDIKS